MKSINKFLVLALLAIGFTGCLGDDDDDNDAFKVYVSGYAYQTYVNDNAYFYPFFIAETSPYSADTITSARVTTNNNMTVQLGKYNWLSYCSAIDSMTMTNNVLDLVGSYSFYFKSNEKEYSYNLPAISGYTTKDVLGKLNVDELTYSGSKITAVIDSVDNAKSYGFVYIYGNEYNGTTRYDLINYNITKADVFTKVEGKVGMELTNMEFRSYGNSFKIAVCAISEHGVVLVSDTKKTLLKDATSFEEDKVD